LPRASWQKRSNPKCSRCSKAAERPCAIVDYALGSLREAEAWIQDGIEFGYFQKDQCRARFGSESGASPQRFA
jgi:hypothetical protein